MMSKPKILAQGKLTIVANTVIYSVPPNTQAKVTAVIMFNSSGASRTVYLACKKQGGATRILEKRSIADSTPFKETTGFMFEEGDELQAWASPSSSIDCTVFGIEYPMAG